MWLAVHGHPTLRHNKGVTNAIVRDPETMHGVPVFRGTRVPVQTLFEYLEAGDTIDDFREDSDLDLLVEFEPGARVTLLDMARMERELGELTGFKVDLRTADDLSRYFRREVLQEAVELHASRG